MITPLLAMALAAQEPAAQEPAAPVTAELWVPEAVRAGEPFWVAVRYEIAPGWHIYWENPGDSGLPTQVSLLLPAGWKASDAHYPGPERFVLPGDVVNYGYERTGALLVEVTPPADAPRRAVVQMSASTSWLQCTADTCQPAQTAVGGETVVRRRARPNDAVLALVRELPRPLSEVRGASLSLTATGAEIWLPGQAQVELFPTWRLETVLRGLEVRAEPDGTRIVLAIDPAARGMDLRGVLALGPEARLGYLQFEIPTLPQEFP